MSKKDGSRFDDLFSAARTDKLGLESKSEPIEKTTRRQSKSTNPDYVRATIYLPKQLHKKLKAAAADEEREMSSIVEELVKQYLESDNHQGK